MRKAWIVIAWALSACGNPSGGHCQTSTECQNGLLCLSTRPAGRDAGAPDVRVCMRLCDYDGGVDAATGGEQHLCADGAACLSIEAMRVCYLGGNHAIGTTCADDLDCEAGTVCAPDTLLCTQACTVGFDAPCEPTETCMDSICRPAPIVVDGGVDDGGVDGGA